MPDSYAYSPGGGSTPGLDPQSLLMLHSLISPADAESLVTPPPATPPPSAAPKTAPGQTTPLIPQSGTPQQAQPKVSGPPMIPGVATEPSRDSGIPSTQPRSGLSRAIASGNVSPGQAGDMGLRHDLAMQVLTGGMSGDEARRKLGNPSGLSGTPNSSAPPSSTAAIPQSGTPMGTTGQATAAPLNLGPATLGPQFQAQPLDYGKLMQMRPSSSNPWPGLPATPSNIAPPAQQRLAQDQAKLDYYQRTGPGVDQIRNRWLKVLGKTADIAGSIFTPGIAEWVPGSTLHNQMLQGMQRGRIAGDQEQIQSAAQTADLASQTREREAQANSYAAAPLSAEEASSLGHPEWTGVPVDPRDSARLLAQQGRNQTTLSTHYGGQSRRLSPEDAAAIGMPSLAGATLSNDEYQRTLQNVQRMQQLDADNQRSNSTRVTTTGLNDANRIATTRMRDATSTANSVRAHTKPAPTGPVSIDSAKPRQQTSPPGAGSHDTRTYQGHTYVRPKGGRGPWQRQ